MYICAVRRRLGRYCRFKDYDGALLSEFLRMKRRAPITVNPTQHMGQPSPWVNPTHGSTDPWPTLKRRAPITVNPTQPTGQPDQWVSPTHGSAQPMANSEAPCPDHRQLNPTHGSTQPMANSEAPCPDHRLQRAAQGELHDDRPGEAEPSHCTAAHCRCCRQRQGTRREEVKHSAIGADFQWRGWLVGVEFNAPLDRV